MIREEVVKDLGVIKDFFAENSGAIPLSIEYAIKVLEQEPCDCVSRQTVLDVLNDKWNMFYDADDAMQESIDTIEALRPATPAPKTGRWIFKQRHKCVDVCCSECGYIRLLDYGYRCTVEELEKSNAMDEIYAKGDLKFCENCGAKMEREENNADSSDTL